MTTKKKLEKLQGIIKKMGRILVAYSGGVDSTFLLKAAKLAVGNNVLAVTAKSGTFTPEEYRRSKQLAKKLGVEQLAIVTSELLNRRFTANPPDRCYHCKKELFSRLIRIARERNIKYVVDGTNLDDSKDYRPGSRACGELGIRSPLSEAGLDKKDIRALSRKLGLPTWNQPAYACLASRIPYGTKIDRKNLLMVSAAEGYLKSLGFSQVRVRHHGDIARIEVIPGEMGRFRRKRLKEKIVGRFRKIGYRYITLDLQGYRTGSMNEALKIT